MRARASDLLRRALAGVVSLLLVAGGMGLLVPAAARADSAPADPVNPATPATVSADPLPTVQINGVVWSQVIVGNTVYAAGQFSRARPAGAAAGTQETVRNNLLAYDIRTGALVTSFAPSLNAQALTVTASPDGRRVYVGGDFTRANGQVRNKVAAFDTATGQLVADWRPSVAGRVMAIAATNTTVYLGGTITAVGSVGRARLAAVRASDGGLLPWAPRPGAGPTDGNKLPLHDANNLPIPGTRHPSNDIPSNDVLALVVTSGGAQVVASGRFYTLNGVRATGIGALDAVTGAVRPFAINTEITNHGVNSAVYSLSTDGSTVYGTGYDFWGPGNLEGAFAANANGGAERWIADCRGDSYSVHGTGSAVYIASHSHDCANIDSFPEQPTRRVHMHANAFSVAATGLNRQVSPLRNNTNFVGEPAPTRLAWDPTFYPGSYTGQYQAGWSVTGNRDYLVYGGEFPGVNGTTQQGLVRFAIQPLAPNRVAPRSTGAFTPTVTPVPGAVRIAWRAVHDRDNENLTYRVYRDVASSTPVCQVTQPSQWWDLRTYGCADTTAPAGSHQYLVTATDPLGNRLASSWTTTTVGAANQSADRPYARLLAADGAQDHWSLGETAGAVARDRLVPQDMTINPGVALGQAGATPADGDRAFAFNGTTGFLASATAVPGPHTFSVEAWFSTTTRAGGKIVGFGNARTGTSSNFDRHVYMDTAGRLNFGVFNGAAQLITTPAAYNDGAWHHVVGTLGRNGMSLYVDGQLVQTLPAVTSAQYYPGFWRVGGDSTWSGSRFFAGRIDEVAVYPTALSARQIAAHDTAARTGQMPNAVPTASFTTAPYHLEVDFDASGSGDSDGRVTGYAWDFGDGTTGEGVTAAHTYAAAGTYTVRLTVTDDRGATATAIRDVAVTAPPVGPGSIAADTFGREVTGGWGVAETGGAWTAIGAPSGLAVTGGKGRLTAAVGTTAGAALGVDARDVAVQADVVLDQAPTGGGSWVTLASRVVGGTRYEAQLLYAADGTVQMSLIRTVAWAETWLAGTTLPGRYTPGTALTVRFEVDGTAPAALKAKAWAKGTAEPASWQVQATDATASLQRVGGLSLDVYTARTATAATAVRVDDVRAEPAGTVVPPPAPNAAPTAAFTATATGLTAAVDASASSDGDGRVTGYAWDFGDGGTGTGVTASHTYAAAGTYQVRLTVTDDAGATGTVTRAVTVTAPVTPPPAGEPTGQVIAADAFGREVTGGLGTADVGGTWATHGTDLGVTEGRARVTAAPGTSAGGQLPVSAQDVAVQVDVALDRAAAGAAGYFSLGARSVDGTRYKTQLRFGPDGTVQLGLVRTVNWTETWLTGTLLPGPYVPGTVLTLRFEVSGTALQAKAWAKGTAEPAAWQVRATDTTAALQRAGGLRLDLYNARAATAAATVRVDDLWAGPAGAVPPAA